ncbi:MAG: phosphatase PAP2 family protein [Candidatus Pacearchaeota archaeon]
MDRVVNLFMESLESPFLTDFSVFVDKVFNPEFLIVLGVLISCYFFYKKSWKKGFVVSGTLVLAGVLVAIFKEVFMKFRPLNPLIETTGYSFPSGHVTISVVFFGLFVYLLSLGREIKTKACFYALFILLILLVSFSRMYLRVHWFTDVLFSLVLGGLILLIGVVVLRKV